MLSLRRLRLSDVEISDEQSCYQGFLHLKKFTLQHSLFAGGVSDPLTRELLERHEAVGVLPYDPRLDAILLIEQFRVGAFSHMAKKTPQDPNDSPWLLELVAGLIDKNENPETVAEREAEEEAGIQLQQLEPIHSYYSSPGGTDEFCYLFCARADLSDASGIHGLATEGEDIRVQVLSVKNCKRLLAEGRIMNAHALIALQWFVMNRDRLRQQWQDAVID